MGLRVYSIGYSSSDIDRCSLKISAKFSRTYCNAMKFGISCKGALKLVIGKTKKEILNKKFNKFIDYELLKKISSLVSIKNFQIEEFPVNRLDNL